MVLEDGLCASPIHDHCVKGSLAVFVRAATEPDCAITLQLLAHRTAVLHSIHC